MSVPMIPIDPDKRDDIYYRYKMPTIQTKVEGSGNGIKTVFPNIHDVCLAINRPEEVLMKFFQSEIGAQRTVLEKDDKFLIMGSHTEERVQEKIYDFIRKFVLCRSCRNPETQLNVETGKKTPYVSMSCGACGKVMKLTDLEPRYVTAIMTYFAKNPKMATRKGAGTAEARATDKTQHTAAPAATAAAPAAAVTETGRKQIQRSDIEDTREPPQKLLARHMEQYPDNNEETMQRCRELLTLYNLKEKMQPLLVLDAIELGEKQFMTGLRRHSRLLKRYCRLDGPLLPDTATDEAAKTDIQKRDKKLQSATIEECARICARHDKADQMVVALFVLFIEGVLERSTIVEWANNETPVSKVDPAVDKKMKETAKPLVEWLE